MKAYLPKDSLVPLLEQINKRMEVIAPIEVEGTPVFSSWKGQTLALKENPLLPPQEFFLPQRDVLFKYVQDCGRYTFTETDPKPRLIFGVRPCDLKALAVLDKLFGAEPPDRPYFEKRRSTALVGLNCVNPQENCFCSSLGAGPQCQDLFDLQLTDIGEGFLAESGSPAGILILKEYPQFFLEPQEEQISKKNELMEKAKAAMHSPERRSLAQIQEAIEKADWEALGRQCLNCGSCTFVCPVCHCFTILDVGVPDGERMRCRDTCLLSGFSRMAGGSNPRKGQGERMQNWYRDKFEYILKKTGMPGCVGCGRCSKVCLAEMDRWKLEASK